MSCPICSNDTDQKFRPFCSKRCADIDLGRWMAGQYRFESTRETDPDEVERELHGTGERSDPSLH